jgi:hypothetical protein
VGGKLCLCFLVFGIRIHEKKGMYQIIMTGSSGTNNSILFIDMTWTAWKMKKLKYRQQGDFIIFLTII